MILLLETGIFSVMSVAIFTIYATVRNTL